ncbi:MAG: hypothetical protein IJS48_03645 [Prevotella sp.]|nr:hypothetical protein [Prevotella sp.]
MKSEQTIVNELRRLMGLMRPMGLMGLIGLMGLMSLVGCSSDDDELQSQTPQGTIIPEVASYVTWFEELQGTSGSSRAEGSSRSNEPIKPIKPNKVWSAPSGFVDYEGGKQPIGIAFTQNGQAPKMGNFFFSSGKWRTSVEDIQTATYYLYGYIPHLPAIHYTLTDIDPGTGGANDKYSTGAIMTLEDVPSVMSSDLCVAIGAKEGTDKETVEGLRRGSFAFAAEPTAKDAPRNYVFLLFDHLYAAIRVKMRVHGDYATMRTIKLKSLQMSTKAGDTMSKDHNTITITLQANDGSASPIQSITYEQTGMEIGSGDEEGLEFWKSEASAGHELTTSYQPFIGYFMPSGITTMILTSKYDVYDTKGNLIREDCKATNTMVLKDLLTEQKLTGRGKRYTINMTIHPTYLYMLSEPDLDNPTVVVN